MHVLLIIIFLFSIRIFACTCEHPVITEKYIESDFVARAKIVKNYKNENSKELYKANIVIKELFKGQEQTSIYVVGRSDGKMGSSCAIFIPENTELIIYARKNADGKYTIGMCSGLLYLNNRNLKKQKRELNILKMFKSQNIDFTNKINFTENGNLYQELKQFNGIKLKKNFGLYEITFAANLTIKSVYEISGFNNSIDSKLIEIIKNTKWNSFNKGVKNKVPENSKFLIGIYYYPKEKGNPSFLSQNYL